MLTVFLHFLVWVFFGFLDLGVWFFFCFSEQGVLVFFGLVFFIGGVVEGWEVGESFVGMLVGD